MERVERWTSRLLLLVEDCVKIPIFGCQRCGECILSHTAFICSQHCPKRLRNGPCGGTSADGSCEVFPERRCVWQRIVRRAEYLKRPGMIVLMEPAHNWRLEKTSAWLNVLTKRIRSMDIFPWRRPLR